MRERETETARECARERERARNRASEIETFCVFVYGGESERGREQVSSHERKKECLGGKERDQLQERERVSVHVCVCERERAIERQRERVCV